MYRLGFVVLLKHQNFYVALELSRQFGGERNLNEWSSYTECRYSETVWFNIPHSVDLVVYLYKSLLAVSKFLRTN